MDEFNMKIQDNVLVRYTGRNPVVEVPPGVEIIGKGAFKENNRLRKVVLPDGLREIREEAFSACWWLESLNLPDSLEVLGPGVFENCIRLSSCRIPSGVTRLPERAFRRCPGLKNVELPDTMVELGEKAFADSGLLSIRLPPRITELPDALFNCCSHLRQVEMPRDLRTIRPGVFIFCFELEELELPPTLEDIGVSVFSANRALRRVSFPDGLAHPDPRFLERLPMEWVQVLDLPGVPFQVMPQSVRHAALVGIALREDRGETLPPDLETDMMAYLSTAWPGFLTEAAGNPALLRFLVRRKVLTREAVDTLLEHLSGADQGETVAMLLEAQKQLPLPDPEEQEAALLRELETGFLSPARFDAAWAIRRDSPDGLTITEYHGPGGDVVVPAGRGEEPVVALASGFLRSDQQITSLVVPEGVRQMGAECFKRHGSLGTVDLPSTLQEIPKFAFQKCAGLTEVHMAPCQEDSREGENPPDRPGDLKRIGMFAFHECPNLTRVTLPLSLEEIDMSAFSDCRSLEALRFPPRLKTIGYGAFCGCSSLAHLEVDPANPWYRMEGPFLLSRDGATLYMVMPTEAEKLAVPDSVVSISNFAFEWSTVRDLIIPASVESIVDSAFESPRLENITFLGIPSEAVFTVLLEDLCRIHLRIHLPRRTRKGSFWEWIRRMTKRGAKFVYG